MWPAWQSQGPSGNGESRGPAGDMVGPFGNGAGAAGSGRNLPANSCLFGGSAAGVGGRSGADREESEDSSFDSWRAQGGAGRAAGGGSRLPGRPLRDSHSGGGGVGGSKGSSQWMPDFSRGSARASSAVPPGERFSGELRASSDFPAGSSVSYGSSSGSSLAAAPLHPPRQPIAPAMREVAPGEEGRRNGGGSGRETFPGDSSFSSFGAGARSQPGGAHQPAAAGPFGTAMATEADNFGGNIEEDIEEDDENPFA